MAADIYPGNNAIGNAFSAAVGYAWKEWLRLFGDTDPAKAAGVIPRIGADASDVGAAIHGALDALGPGYPGGTLFAGITGPVVATGFGDVLAAVTLARPGYADALTPGGTLHGAAPRLNMIVKTAVHAELLAALGAGAPYPSHTSMKAAIVQAIAIVWQQLFYAWGYPTHVANLLGAGYWADAMHALVDPYVVNPPP